MGAERVIIFSMALAGVEQLLPEFLLSCLAALVWDIRWGFFWYAPIIIYRLPDSSPLSLGYTRPKENSENSSSCFSLGPKFPNQFVFFTSCFWVFLFFVLYILFRGLVVLWKENIGKYIYLIFPEVEEPVWPIFKLWFSLINELWEFFIFSECVLFSYFLVAIFFFHSPVYLLVFLRVSFEE